jgi:SnoaL-like protein
MESAIEKTPVPFWIGRDATSKNPDLVEEPKGSRGTVSKAVMTVLAVLAIAAMVAWGGPGLWNNTMTGEEAANAMLVRDEVFGDLIGYADYGELPALVAPDAELSVPGGTLVGPEGMRALVQEMDRVESTSSLLLLDVTAQGNLVMATWTIDRPAPSSLLGFESPSDVDDYASGQMLLTMKDQQIVDMTMTTWAN